MLNKYLWAAIGWTIFITVLCLISGNSLHSVDVFSIPHKDKILHFIFYFVFTIVWYLCFRIWFRNSVKIRTLVFVLAVVYGSVIEICQLEFASGRSADIADAFANTTGSATAVFLLWIYRRRKK